MNDDRNDEVRESGVAPIKDAPTPPAPADLELEPVRRDTRFLFRLVAALLVGGIAAAFVGYKIQHAAAGCGAGLVRPGSTVIPPGEGQPATH